MKNLIYYIPIVGFLLLPTENGNNYSKKLLRNQWLWGFYFVWHVVITSLIIISQYG